MERINRKTVSGVLLIALVMAMLSIGTQTGCGCGTGPESSAVSKDQAIALVLSDIVQPAAGYRRISAAMPSQPLQNGDVVTSESGQTYVINSDMWFVFVDDDPLALFAHDCRYIFIDAGTGSYDVVNETWPPEINNLSMWDTENLDRRPLTELYSVLDSAVPIAGSPSEAPAGDYGDAPDGQDAYYGVPGRYPTLFSTINSQLGRPGAHTLNIGEETLGVSVSGEADGNDPADPDGAPNLVDADSDDGILVIVEGTQAKLAFTVTVAPNAANVTRYANALIDFDQNGSWSAGSCGTEWVLVNLAVDVGPGSSETVVTPCFSWGNEAVLPSPVWMRLLLAREEVDEALFANVAGWDGSGEFQYGAVEDYFVFLTDTPSLPGFDSWPPAPANPPRGDMELQLLQVGGAKPPCLGPSNCPCGYNTTDYAIIVNGGDNKKDLAKNNFIMKPDQDRMANLARDQGCMTIANLGPGNATIARNNTLSDIGKAFDDLKNKVKCGDRVLIYITGHGGNSTVCPPDGGIGLRDGSGNRTDILHPSNLTAFLSRIPCCPDQACNTTGRCCNITVIMDCCYAGGFNVTGVTGECRTVMGTSNNTTSYDAVYTKVFDKACRNATFDRNGDGCVSPEEAHVSAVKEVEDWNSKPPRTYQTPWLNPGSNCTCKCPHEASINATKWVGDPRFTLMQWVDEIEAEQGQRVKFRLQAENDGKCCNLTGLVIKDLLPNGLTYADGAILFLNGVQVGPKEPDDVIPAEDWVTYTWHLQGIGALAPGETVAIEYDAIARDVGHQINSFAAAAYCAVDPSKFTVEGDAATVTVTSGTPEEVCGDGIVSGSEECDPGDPANGIDPVPCPEGEECTDDCQCESGGDVYVEEVLEVGVGGGDSGCTCWFTKWDSQYECDECTVTIDFWAEDISSGGNYPVTSVALKVNGAVKRYSGSISQSYYGDTYLYYDAVCGDTLYVEVTATNSIGEAVVEQAFGCPSDPW